MVQSRASKNRWACVATKYSFSRSIM